MAVTPELRRKIDNAIIRESGPNRAELEQSIIDLLKPYQNEELGLPQPKSFFRSLTIPDLKAIGSALKNPPDITPTVSRPTCPEFSETGAPRVGQKGNRKYRSRMSEYLRQWGINIQPAFVNTALAEALANFFESKETKKKGFRIV